MEKNVAKISEVKKDYTVYADENMRGFFANLKNLQSDAEAAEAVKTAEAAEAEATKQQRLLSEAVKTAKQKKGNAEAAEALEAAKKAAAEAAEAVKTAKNAVKALAADTKRYNAVKALAEVMQRKSLKADNICKEYLQQWLPLRFNEAAQICKVTLIPLDAEAEAREAFKDDTSVLIERDNHLFTYIPIRLFTANQFLQLFTAAADAKQKAAKQKAAAEREAEAAAKNAREIEAMRAKVAAYDAKQKAEAATETK